MSESAVYTATAQIFQIDPITKKEWKSLSEKATPITFYYDSAKNSYRIVSVDSANQALINSNLTSNITFSTTSSKFGQWIDGRAATIYGVGFSNENDLIKFADKFNEIKESMRPQSRPLTNGAATSELIEKFKTLKKEETETLVPKKENGWPVDQCYNEKCLQMIEQLKTENEQIKAKLVDSSSNVSGWEVELRQLRTQNQQYKTALEESTKNVKEWQRQLEAYSEESRRLKAQVMQNDNHDSQLQESRRLLENSDRIVKQKQAEIVQLKRNLEEMKNAEIQTNKLTTRLQVLEDEKMQLRRQVTELRQQTEAQSGSSSFAKHRIDSLQKQMSDKINELYTMNDQLADVLLTITNGR